MRIRDLFNESPFEPVRHHMDKVRECIDLLLPMFERVREKDFDGLEELTRQVYKVEHEADVIKTEIRRTIPKSFFLPVYRGDLLGYLKLQDDMADSVENVAVMLTIKRLALPESLCADVLDYVRKVLKVCEHVYEITRMLRTLAATGLEGDVIEDVLEVVAKAEHAEWETDKAQFELARKLFALEDEIRATDIFLWSGIFEEMGSLANYAEKTGDRVRRMLTS